MINFFKKKENHTNNSKPIIEIFPWLSSIDENYLNLCQYLLTATGFLEDVESKGNKVLRVVYDADDSEHIFNQKLRYIMSEAIINLEDKNKTQNNIKNYIQENYKNSDWAEQNWDNVINSFNASVLIKTGNLTGPSSEKKNTDTFIKLKLNEGGRKKTRRKRKYKKKNRKKTKNKKRGRNKKKTRKKKRKTSKRR